MKRVLDPFAHVLCIVMVVAIAVNVAYGKHGQHECRNYIFIITLALVIGVVHELLKRRQSNQT